MSTKIPVSLIGVGLVGSQVISQLSSPLLSTYFRLSTLSNSAHTLSISPTASVPSSDSLLSLLPSSSSPIPSTPLPHSGLTLSPFIPKNLISSLAQDGLPHILIDCTSSLPITELYPFAISSGLSVVTPNKKGFSSSQKLFEEIVEAQKGASSGLVYLESTVGAGLPIISTLKDLVKTGDEVTKIEGVLSGTLSYIFNEFSKPGGGAAPKFSDVVKIAKESGYTEPHPADDLSGSDVGRKLTILSRLLPASSSLPALPEGYASLSTETLIPAALEGLATGEEFVAKLPEHDAEFEKMRKDAEDQGKVLRYVGLIDVKAGIVKCGLELYPYSHPFASSLSGSDNIIAFHTARYSTRPLIVQGAGAGAAVTAMGVVADAIKVAERYGVKVGF